MLTREALNGTEGGALRHDLKVDPDFGRVALTRRAVPPQLQFRGAACGDLSATLRRLPARAWLRVRPAALEWRDQDGGGLLRVDTGNRIVAALNSAPFQVASIYAAEPRESSFTPSGRSSPLGDTCR